MKDTWGSSLRRSSHLLHFSRAVVNARGGSLARLDRIYISSFLEELGGCFAILVGLTFSDHQPMRLDLNPPRGSKGSLNVKIPTKIMKSVEVKAGLQSIWRAPWPVNQPVRSCRKNWPSPPPFYNRRPSVPSNRSKPLRQN